MKAYDDICVRVYRESEKECAVLSLETLVAEILPSSIPAEFEGEALRAQAVVMRTNIARQLPVYNGRGCDVHPGADICDPGHCLGWMSRIRQ